MTAHHSVADVAALIGEPTRAAMLIALLDGRALPASELAFAAGLSAPATSLHLAKLARGGLVRMRQQGRHRYYRLTSAEVAHAIEALGTIATGPPPARSLSPAREALRTARTCYDHLAGALAVDLAELLQRRGVLRRKGEHAFALGKDGRRWLADALRIDVDPIARGKRPFALQCLDWTERRPHVAGALGAAILSCFIERRWIGGTPDSRAVRLTERGRASLRDLGLE
jgi:DNA-binding transcriptional ArsR family regulator